MRFTLYRLTALVIDAAQLILIVRAVVSFLPVNRTTGCNTALQDHRAHPVAHQDDDKKSIAGHWLYLTFRR